MTGCLQTLVILQDLFIRVTEDKKKEKKKESCVCTFKPKPTLKVVRKPKKKSSKSCFCILKFRISKTIHSPSVDGQTDRRIKIPSETSSSLFGMPATAPCDPVNSGRRTEAGRNSTRCPETDSPRGSSERETESCGAEMRRL